MGDDGRDGRAARTQSAENGVVVASRNGAPLQGSRRRRSTRRSRMRATTV
jgi:hypothetical protein